MNATLDTTFTVPARSTAITTVVSIECDIVIWTAPATEVV
jgi:hypothetical protein